MLQELYDCMHKCKRARVPARLQVRMQVCMYARNQDNKATETQDLVNASTTIACIPILHGVVLFAEHATL